MSHSGRSTPLLEACQKGANYVFNLGCDMGGMGFIELNKALCMLSVLTSTHMLVAARDAGANRLFSKVAWLAPYPVRRLAPHISLERAPVLEHAATWIVRSHPRSRAAR